MLCLGLDERLSGDTDDTTSGSSTAARFDNLVNSADNCTQDLRVTGLQGLGVVGLAQVVLTGVNDNGSADDRVGTDKRELRVADLDLGDTGSVGLDVA